jgi:omega-6 fatty acid desaturase (delta-12 desaturase)
MIHHAIDEALLLLTPSSIWRRTHHFHHYHHSHNGCLQTAGIGSFPVMTTRAFARASRRQRLLYALSRHPFTMLSGYVTVFLYGMCLRPRLPWKTKVQATPELGRYFP